MIAKHRIGLAHLSDASAISRMSRDYVEQGLGWSWTPTRVVRSIRDRATNVAVVREGGSVLGFGIMKYGDDIAHLHLLAVHRAQRRRGIAAALLAWLEASARTAGVEKIRVEARLLNHAARAFYRSGGYQEVELLAGYYRGTEDAVRMEKRLWADSGTGLVAE